MEIDVMNNKEFLGSGSNVFGPSLCYRFLRLGNQKGVGAISPKLSDFFLIYKL